MKPGAKASFKITTSSWQIPVLPARPSSHLFCIKFPISPLRYFLLGLPRLLVTSDMNQNLNKNDRVFALVSEKSGVGELSFRHRWVEDLTQCQQDFFPSSAFSMCWQVLTACQHHCQPWSRHMSNSVLISVYKDKILVIG